MKYQESKCLKNKYNQGKSIEMILKNLWIIQSNSIKDY